MALLHHERTDVEPVVIDTAEPTTTQPRARRRLSISAPGPGFVTGLLGAAGIVVSWFLSWQAPSVHADHIPFAFLFDRNTAAWSPSLLLVLIPAAALVVLGCVMPRGRAFRFLGAFLALATVGLFAYQLHGIAPDGDFGAALDTGFYVAAVGAVLATTSAFAARGLHTRPTSARRSMP